MVVGSSSILSDESGKSSKRNGTLVEFTPDREIFGDFTFREEFLQDRCQHYAHLNAGLRIQMNGMDFISEDGFTLRDMFRAEISSHIIQKAKDVFVVSDSSKFGCTVGTTKRTAP